MVLEDNLRVPSGAGYAIVNRRLLGKHLPELQPPADIEEPDRAPQMLLDTLRAAAPPHASGEPAVALLSSGWSDSAGSSTRSWPRRWASPSWSRPTSQWMDGRLLRHIGSDVKPIDVIYARMDEDMLLSSIGYDGVSLRPGLFSAMNDGNLTIANALGSGVGDDKAIYAYVPAMIEYYLGEKPSLAQVPTWICAERTQRDYVLAHLANLVVKPIDGCGGSGVLIGPERLTRRSRRAATNCSPSPSGSSPRNRWHCRRIRPSTAKGCTRTTSTCVCSRTCARNPVGSCRRASRRWHGRESRAGARESSTPRRAAAVRTPGY